MVILKFNVLLDASTISIGYKYLYEYILLLVIDTNISL